MKIKSKIINCGLALAFTSGIATAQEEPKETKSLMEKYPKLENLYFGLGAGTSISFTDIKQHAYWPAFNPVNEIALGGHGFWGYQLNNIFSVEGSLFLGNLKGQDRDKSLWFNGNITELGINGKINLSNISFSNKKVNRKFNVYAKGGFGFAWFKSELRVLGNGDENDVLVQTEGYESRFNTDNPNRTVSGLLNVGIGASYKLTKKVDIFAETNLRLMDTDKLDAWVSQNNDAHNYNSIGVIYRLGDKSWVKPEDEFIDKLAKLDSIMDGFKDADGDGVMDLNDKDNKTPAGAMVYGNGAPVDTDGDGVPDHLDKERLSPCTQVDADGVALDSDKDGVNDCKDAEPNSEADCQVDVKGKCIDTKSSAIPTPTSDGGAVTSGLPSVFFELNASSIDYRNYPTLTQVAQFLKSNPKVNLVLVGHTDVSGTDDYNKALGQKRAQSVADHLVKIYGIDKSRITVTSKGASEPLAKTTTARVNRRVDFLIGK